MKAMPDPAAATAARALAQATGVAKHHVAVVLGSGWGGAAQAIGPARAEFAMGDLPGFAAPSTPGHAGRIRSVQVGDRNVLVLLGRTHLYENHGVDAVVHGARMAVAAGASTVVLTNACGSLRPDFGTGRLVLIADQLNLTGVSPLRGPLFLDLSELYNAQLRALARDLDPSLADGVYAQLSGPQYETPAEIRMLRTLGADVVGMSTALEAIAARAAGARVLGISLVTNLAAGLSGEPVAHQEVLRVGRESAAHTGELLAALVRRL